MHLTPGKYTPFPDVPGTLNKTAHTLGQRASPKKLGGKGWHPTESVLRLWGELSQSQQQEDNCKIPQFLDMNQSISKYVKTIEKAITAAVGNVFT